MVWYGCSQPRVWLVGILVGKRSCSSLELSEIYTSSLAKATVPWIYLILNSENCVSGIVMVYLGTVTFDLTLSHLHRFLTPVSTLFPCVGMVIIFSLWYANQETVLKVLETNPLQLQVNEEQCARLRMFYRTKGIPIAQICGPAAFSRRLFTCDNFPRVFSPCPFAVYLFQLFQNICVFIFILIFKLSLVCR